VRVTFVSRRKIADSAPRKSKTYRHRNTFVWCTDHFCIPTDPNGIDIPLRFGPSAKPSPRSATIEVSGVTSAPASALCLACFSNGLRKSRAFLRNKN